MNTILGPIVERLRALPSSLMETVAAQASVPLSLPRKLRARDRTDPKLSTIQPLLDYFARIDAGELPLPNEPLFILLYNPFVGPTMAHVLRNIEESLRAFPREVIILYAKPLMASAFRASPCLTEIVTHENYRIYRSVDACWPLAALGHDHLA